MEHFLMKHLEKKQTSCPFCAEQGKYSSIIWDLHPWDSNTQSVSDQCRGHCNTCDAIIIAEVEVLFRKL